MFGHTPYISALAQHLAGVGGQQHQQVERPPPDGDALSVAPQAPGMRRAGEPQ